MCFDTFDLQTTTFNLILALVVVSIFVLQSNSRKIYFSIVLMMLPGQHISYNQALILAWVEPEKNIWGGGGTSDAKVPTMSEAKEFQRTAPVSMA